MDKDTVNPAGNNGPRNARSSRSADQPPTAATGPDEGSSEVSRQDHDALALFAAASRAQPGQMSYELFTQTRRNMHELQGSYPYIPPAQGFPPNYLPHEHMGHPHNQPPHNHDWAQHLPPHFLQSQYDLQQHGHHYSPGLGEFPYAVPPQQQLPPVNTNTNSRSPVPASQRATSSSMSPTDNTDQTEEGTSEDKRRRNTAASARFRIKKKQRSLNLDRSVSDLTGRAEELEREATELRRENSWLKEIVMLKGRSLSGAIRATETSDDESESDDEDSSVASKKNSKIKGKGKGKANK